ncbi:MAG: hypothetical protein P4L83_21425 [Nevskia sp.]|nr:hypothetical protein [Nevskia sp.]
MFDTLLKKLIRPRLAAFERAYDYDMSYAHDMLDASPAAVLKFNRLMAMARHREEVPLDAWYAAKLAATMAEDCGPCTQLVATMAEREGVAPQVLRGILQRDPAALPADAALGLRYARAVLAHDLQAQELQREVVHRWGRKALLSLAFAVTTSRMFPTLKYALGHGHACVRVRVGGVEMPVQAAA